MRRKEDEGRRIDRGGKKRRGRGRRPRRKRKISSRKY